MRNIIAILLLVLTQAGFGQIKTGEKVPQYTFTEILNGDRRPFDISTQGKPLILEFWATWCSPCIPAMTDLEKYQKKFGDQLEILTVSDDKVSRLLRYIDNTNTSLRIAFDSAHHDIFGYKSIPHTVLIDKDGFVKAITAPDLLTEELIADLIAGRDIKVNVGEEKPTNINLFKEVKNEFYQYTLTSGDPKRSFKNEIKRNESNEPVSLEFYNVSIYRLLTDIYELTTAARLDVDLESISKNKYCFTLEHSSGYKKSILEHAKEILNENSGFKARLVEKTLDSMYTLQIIDSTKLPVVSASEKRSMEFGGPYFKGVKISTSQLIMYLENVTFLPVKDKTGIQFSFDLTLDWSLENPKSLNQELSKYGLRMIKSSVPEKIVLLEVR